MKSSILTVLLFCAIFSAFTQAPDAGQQFIRKKCGVERVHLSQGKNGQKYPIIFDSIQVIDLRKDTSRIGLIGTGRYSQDEIVFRAQVAMEVSAYLNAIYTRPLGSSRLLVAIKDLWISGPDTYRGTASKSVWNVAFRFEAYLKTAGGYIPLTYLDTLAPGEGSSLEIMAAHHLPDLIAVFMDKVADHAMGDDLASKRVVSYDQIDSFSRTRFNYPMDTATILAKGVYASAREFRNNAPSIPTYEISKDKSGDLALRIPDENGQFYYTHTVWGFCDGKQAYKMMDGNVFQIFNVYHQFYVLGSNEYRNKQVWIPLLIPLGATGVLLSGVTDVSDNVIRTLRVFRLDVHSGRVTQ